MKHIDRLVGERLDQVGLLEVGDEQPSAAAAGGDSRFVGGTFEPREKARGQAKLALEGRRHDRRRRSPLGFTGLRESQCRRYAKSGLLH